MAFHTRSGVHGIWTSCTPKGRSAGFAYLREFIEDVKASGLVAKTIEKNNVRGLTVSAKA